MVQKQALCIGINTYIPSRLTLRPCINDAKDLSNSLHSIGFQVYCETDSDLNSMKSVTRRFVRSIQPGAIVVFYFSGHGVQSDGNNYLIPKNAAGICADNIKSTAIDAQQLINEMYEKKPRLIICILDCCRTDPPDNPLDGKSPFDRALAGTRPGFAPMQTPPSSIIVYACAADDAASARSKNGRNSLYTSHLLRYIRTPNVDIETILRQVASAVQRESNNEQIPCRYSSCNEFICLVSNKGHHTLLPPQHMQAGPFVRPANKHHRKAISCHHLEPRHHNDQHQLNDQLDLPTNHHVVARSPSPHRNAIPVEVGSPYPKEARHHRR